MEALLAHCSAALTLHKGLLALFFLGGLTGSLTHCLLMCGPVVACQSACAGGCGKRTNASQWEYHLGRFLTYGAFGFFSALISRQLSVLSYWPALSSTMMVMAGGLFFLSAVFPHSHRLFTTSSRNSFVRGVAMSFMPCGLLYAALMMASTLANPWAGMFAMWLFVLGTMPVLFIASGGAAALAVRWQEIMSGIGRFGMAFNGLALLAMAARIMR
jgi:sulfite exporter TauE/SafE